jgi:hypothetical protein
MQRFVPPLVGRHAEPRDRGRVVLQLRDLFIERHARDQIRGAFLEAAVEVLVDRIGGERRGYQQTTEQDGAGARGQSKHDVSSRRSGRRTGTPLVFRAVALTYTSTCAQASDKSQRERLP